MDLHKQSQEQNMAIDLNTQSLNSVEHNYYQNHFNERALDSSQVGAHQGQSLFEQEHQQRLMTAISDNNNPNLNNSNSSSATSTPLPQSYPASNSDMMSVHTVLSQQSAEMNGLPMPSPKINGTMTSGTPQSLDHGLGQNPLSLNNSPCIINRIILIRYLQPLYLFRVTKCPMVWVSPMIACMVLALHQAVWTSINRPRLLTQNTQCSKRQTTWKRNCRVKLHLSFSYKPHRSRLS
ncbi:hypothetical protein BY458DRAFT_495971 [Sporodiniella umbellata]|nr:hypothetical protein BY458DRAFT_495971 [Sporodiniella umbellata]